MEAAHNSVDYLKRGYLGELRGEATFRAFIDLFPERGDSLELLAEVERATAAMLKPHVRAKITDQELDRARDQAAARREGFNVDSWQDLMAAILPIVEKALVMMREAESHAPAELLSVYQTFTAHEQALLDFLVLEGEGKPGEHVLTRYLASLA